MTTTRLTISQAAEKAGVSRQWFHKKYINTGVISKSKDKNNKPYIEFSEFHRVFGDSVVYTDDSKEVETKRHEVTQEVTLLKQELAALKEDLRERKDREKYYQDHIKQLTLMLEHKPAPKPSNDQVKKSSPTQPEQSKREKTLAIIRKNKRDGESMEECYNRLKNKRTPTG